MLHQFTYDQPFTLESGAVLPQLTIAYCTYGQLQADKSNVVWICHALTASADAADWWPGMVGEGGAFDPARHFIVCANILGSCYGTTGPLSVNPDTGLPYYGDFPQITIRDMVRAHILLREHLGIEQIMLLAGGSMGGYQALEWAVTEPGRIGRLLLLATSAAETAWGIAIHTAQRLAIEADSTWGSASPDAGSKGLKAARAIGMLTYRNHSLFIQQQTDDDPDKTDHFKAESYIRYQGDKLVNRFNAYSYRMLTKAMDSHNIARGRAAHYSDVLKKITQPVLLIGIQNDLLCPAEIQRGMAAVLPRCHYEEIASAYGHDGFLIEAEKISACLHAWQATLPEQRAAT